MSNRLLDNFLPAERGGESAHRVDVAAPQPLEVGKSSAEIVGYPVGHPGALLGGLSLHDGVPDGPVQLQQVGVDDTPSTPLRRAHLGGELLEDIA